MTQFSSASGSAHNIVIQLHTQRVDISNVTGIYAKAKEQLSLAGLDVSEIDVATKEKN